ncbi:DUF829 domain-containing protein [Cephalotus follicularis]|uniref:DUF829 domain-containing protein n=1 Tax=Cephalotus follicularis TaxID=3775 RepID=A0A1Q3BR15_CEPFO|nr:DUF829 domain-containing protein [Cephalotus follicularis]
MFGGGGGGGDGNGDGVYWGRKEGDRRGIVVMFAWGSISDKQLRDYVDLYTSLRWNSLLSHSHFLHAFYPEKAMAVAFVLLSQLVQELKIRTCPIVFVAFSGGSKSCLYKVLQILQGIGEGQLDADEVQLVKSCVSGHIYDSSPVDFTSDLGAQFAFHSSIRNFSGPLKLVSWVAKGIAFGLDGLYLTRFECQRAEYWQTLYSSVDFGAPFLILCSEDDGLLPYQVICKFSRRLQDLGGDVNFVKWNGSPHIGHYKHYPIQYRAAVTALLEKAESVYLQRNRELGLRVGLEGTRDEISELICDLQKAALNSNQSLRRVALGPSDHFFLPSSAEYHNGKESVPLQDEQKGRSVILTNPPRISAHSVLGQVLFDACVPKNVEGWDIRFSGSLNGQPLASARRRSPFQGFKCNRRSRL